MSNHQTASTESAKGATRAARLLQIDGLRALAALSVVAFHYTTRFDGLFLHTADLSISAPSGFLGVNLFFGISGFVIFMTIDKISRPSEFVVSRFARLYPAYWAAVLITWALVTLMGLPGYSVTLWQAIANLAMFHTYFGVPDVDGVYWSLQVELLFYIWMLVLWTIGALRRAELSIATWVAIALGASIADRLFGIHVPWAIEEFLLLEWIPWFALGMICYASARNSRWTALQGCIGACCVLAIVARDGMPRGLVALLVFGLIYAASRDKLKFLSGPTPVFLGSISYPLYLIHEKVGWTVISIAEEWGRPPVLAIGLALGASLLLATALHYAIENPARRYIRDIGRSAPDPRPFTRRSAQLWGLCGIAAISVFAAASVIATRARARSEWHPTAVLATPMQGSETPCESNNASPARLIIVLGQGNAESSTQGPATRDELIRVAGGRCWKVRDPLPGTSGSGSSIWTALSRVAEVEPRPTRLAFAVFTVAELRLSDFVEDGEISAKFKQFLKDAADSGLPVAAVLLQQGESDAALSTPAARYRDSLIALRTLLDQEGISEPLVVAHSTRCNSNPSEPLHRAVLRARESHPSIQVGPDTDTLGAAFRYDGCHFNAAGREAAAQMWMDAIRPILGSR